VITQVGGVLGTVNYMAPEQAIDSSAVDHLADVYSLGATLFYLLTGRPPYAGKSTMAVLLKHRDEPVPCLRTARSDVPAELDSLFRRMVAKAPGDRVKTMADVVTELEAIKSRLADHQGVSLTDRLRAGPAAPPAAGSTEHGQAAARSVLPQEGADQTVDLSPPPARLLLATKILLVEPSRTQAAIIRNYLQTAGIGNIVVVGSGNAALRLVREDRFDAIVSAMHLSDLTGVELAGLVRATGNADTPGFVLVSSEAESEEEGALFKHDRAILLRKPFTPDGLLNALNAVAGARPSSGVSSRRAKANVLIVDDSTAARVHARKVLEGLGFAEFSEAADGAGAVAALAGKKFELVVTDYNMPFMDGAGLIGYLKQNPATAGIPVILVTTETDPAKLDVVRQLGVTAVCDKSFRSDAVRKIVDQLVELA
jgi:two-component system chemotaxis response regulator CheY